ncbi:MAG: phasin family protein [Leptolyngbyaceae cyanobacterium SM1_1_3]|nr:phasin family protein [Leptolyngbyaceae cyanobacterium SM1_1_3]NJN01633.1 phasin family protein [Leptolyngbyaceae cyanobacterium RM1_1_2]NJO10586.1 phasin family protein [Leptolyngbyaceae cyanobacterium SL_1_1]
MAGFGDLVQKAFYLGVGIASYAGEKAGGTLGELRGQAQKIVDELVARGEMTTDEAQRLINEMMNRAQEAPGSPQPSSSKQPRHIEIIDDDSALAEIRQEEMLRQQVEALRQELQNLKRKE